MAKSDRRCKLACVSMKAKGLDALLVDGEHEGAGPAPVKYDARFAKDYPGTTVVFPRMAELVSFFPMALFAMDHLEISRRGNTV